MSDSLYSSSWYRVERLKPRLRSHVEIHRHHYRGQRWYVLHNHSSGRHHRLNPSAYHFIGLMDGERSVQALWEATTTEFGDEAATQDETIALLGQLHAADMLQTDVPPDTAELFERHTTYQRTQWKKRFWNPLALRIPLLDPERFLVRWQGWVRPLFTRTAALVWLLVVGLAVVLAAQHWTELTRDVVERTLDPKNLLLLVLLYPLVKALHEFGHAFATKVWGGEVQEMGITLLVFMPIPYVDASAASSFRDKYQRILVGAAGMAVELLLAALALCVWLNVEPGLVSAMAFNVALIGSVSTLLFNGNPLLRFDAYYILADAVEIPNLGSRSTRYFGYLLRRYLFGVENLSSPATSRGERLWFLGYGLASLVYRLFILAVIVLFVGGKFFFVGIMLAVWAAATQILLPIAKQIAGLFHDPRLGNRRFRAVLTSAGLTGVILFALFALPAPLWTRSEGIVWLPEHAQVRVATDCFIERILVQPDAPVRQGEALAACQDPLLDVNVKLKQAQLQELQARYNAEGRDDRVRGGIIREQIATVKADLERARERRRDLIVRSPNDGLFVVPGADDLPGRFLSQGDLIGYVMDNAELTVRVVVTQAQIGLVRERTRKVEARLAENVARVLPARMQREVPAATDRLPSPALGSKGGGALAVDPQDAQGIQALEQLFQIDLRLPDELSQLHAGGRVHVRFYHGSEPLGLQWYRSLRQLFLSRFSV